MQNHSAKSENDGQIFLEYVIVIGIVVLIMLAMGKFITRGSQGMIKIASDQIGNQINAEQLFDEEQGFLKSSYTSGEAKTSRTKTEFLGDATIIFDDEIKTETNSVTDLGFVEKE